MNAQVVMIGAGMTGSSCVRHAVREGLSVMVMDHRDVPPDWEVFRATFPDVPFHLGGVDMAVVRQAERVVVSPGLAPHAPVIQALKAEQIPFQTDIDLFVKSAKAPIIGITGSNGKSTVTTLVHQLLLAQGWCADLGGNIGIPVLDLLANEVPDVYVLELSSAQLAHSKEMPLVAACILNVSDDHADWHGDFERYVQAKQRILKRAAYTVANRQDALTLPERAWTTFAADVPASCHWGVRDVNGRTYLSHGHDVFLPVDALALWGVHQWENVLAACALVDAFCSASSSPATECSLPPSLRAAKRRGNLRVSARQKCARSAHPSPPMLAVLKTFFGLPHRCQKLRELHGVTWYNDSKGTNPEATLVALRSVRTATTGRVVLLLGGMRKGADFTALAQAMAEAQPAVLAMVYGEDAPSIAAALRSAHVEVMRVADLAEAVQASVGCVDAGDAVLLSPACASWDQFKNYIERGERFEQYVKDLG